MALFAWLVWCVGCSSPQPAVVVLDTGERLPDVVADQDTDPVESVFPEVAPPPEPEQPAVVLTLDPAEQPLPVVVALAPSPEVADVHAGIQLHTELSPRAGAAFHEAGAPWVVAVPEPEVAGPQPGPAPSSPVARAERPQRDRTLEQQDHAPRLRARMDREARRHARLEAKQERRLNRREQRAREIDLVVHNAPPPPPVPPA